MNLLGMSSGATRRVLVVGPLAFKFAIGARGRRCNRFEVDLFHRTSDIRRAMLCPVLWCSQKGALLVARAAQPLTEPEAEHLLEVDGFPDWDYVPPDETAPFEYKSSDWGRLEGRLVALDYSAPALFD
jgi:hypothetical protein